MKAAVLFETNTPLVVRDLRIDKPRTGEVLVRVVASGLCHSDLHFIRGDMPCACPVVLGHEVAGIVEAVGPDVRGLAIGDHVVGCASSFCGRCQRCMEGRTHLCGDKPGRGADDAPCLDLDGQRIGQGTRLGGFAEQILVPQSALVRIARDMPLDRAALLGCGVLTGLGSVFNTARIHAGSSVVVIGCGGVGLNIIQAARIAGAATIIAVDLSPDKLALARRFGATATVAGGEDAVEAVRTLSRGGVDYAFEAIGLQVTLEQAVHMLAQRGVLTVVGAQAAGDRFAVPGLMLLANELRVQGSMMGSSAFAIDVPRYVDLYLNGSLELDLLIAERIGLADLNGAFERMVGGAIARSVVMFDDAMQP